MWVVSWQNEKTRELGRLCWKLANRSYSNLQEKAGNRYLLVLNSLILWWNSHCNHHAGLLKNVKLVVKEAQEQLSVLPLFTCWLEQLDCWYINKLESQKNCYKPWWWDWRADYLNQVEIHHVNGKNNINAVVSRITRIVGRHLRSHRAHPQQ